MIWSVGILLSAYFFGWTGMMKCLLFSACVSTFWLVSCQFRVCPFDLFGFYQVMIVMATVAAEKLQAPETSVGCKTKEDIGGVQHTSNIWSQSRLRPRNLQPSKEDARHAKPSSSSELTSSRALKNPTLPFSFSDVCMMHFSVFYIGCFMGLRCTQSFRYNGSRNLFWSGHCLLLGPGFISFTILVVVLGENGGFVSLCFSDF